MWGRHDLDLLTLTLSLPEVMVWTNSDRHTNAHRHEHTHEHRNVIVTTMSLTLHAGSTKPVDLMRLEPGASFTLPPSRARPRPQARK